jgi:hypothetical protein
MDPVANYYINTLTTALGKIGPLVAFIVVGYFIFFKLPFLFFLRNMKKSKEELGIPKEVVPQRTKEGHSIQEYEKFVQRKKRIEAPREKEERKENLRLEAPGTRSRPRDEDERARELFELKVGEVFSKEELRKKYRDLLKANHPDKVASLSPEFRALADKRTKDINSAYERLLKRAA